MRFTDREPFVTHLARAMPVLLVMVGLGVAVQKLGLYGPIERMVIDAFAASEPTRTANHTFIFDIDGESYDTVFEKRSPLDYSKLAALIQAAGDGGARAVAVDIETDREKVLESMGSVGNMPIVWARDATPCLADTTCILPPPASEPQATEGIALLLTDTDGAVRRYRPEFNVSSGNDPASCTCSSQMGQPTRPSFPRAAARAARIDTHVDTDGALLLNWSGDRFAVPRIPANRVLIDSRERWWGEAQPIRGRIVLIGGTFPEGRDVRWTPVGEMSGVELMAQIIEAEATRGAGLVELKVAGAIAVDVLLSILLVWVNWRYPTETKTGLTLNAAIVLALPVLASWVLHRYALYWVNMGPVLAGVWISQSHTRAKMLAERRW